MLLKISSFEFPVTFILLSFTVSWNDSKEARSPNDDNFVHQYYHNKNVLFKLKYLLSPENCTDCCVKTYTVPFKNSKLAFKSPKSPRIYRNDVHQISPHLIPCNVCRNDLEVIRGGCPTLSKTYCKIPRGKQIRRSSCGTCIVIETRLNNRQVKESSSILDKALQVTSSSGSGSRSEILARDSRYRFRVVRYSGRG